MAEAQNPHRPAGPAAGQATRDFDVVIVGAGFAGMYMLHRIRELGLSARVFEAGSGVGGTWCWNRNPGARCDVESMAYSYQFSEELQQQWHWTERFAAQPEMLRYENHVADRFGLRADIRFDTRVEAAHFDEQTGRWNVRTMTQPDGARGHALIEAREDAWVGHVNSVADATLFPSCSSWYLGA